MLSSLDKWTLGRFHTYYTVRAGNDPNTPITFFEGGMYI